MNLKGCCKSFVMKIGKCKYRFFLRGTKTQSQKPLTIYCKLETSEQTRVISTFIKVPTKAWSSKNLISGSEYHTESYMFTLWVEKLKKKLLESYIQSSDVCLDTLIKHLNPEYRFQEMKKPKGFIEVFELFINKMKPLIGKEYTKSTITRFTVLKDFLLKFIKHQYNKSDFSLDAVKFKFLLDFEEYSLQIAKHQVPTLNKNIQRLKQVLKYAEGHEYIDKNPWVLHKSKVTKTDIVYLSNQELDLLKNITNLSDKLEKVRDCFLFSCYSGLAYAELKAIQENHLTIKNGVQWILMNRIKTNNNFLIPMLPPALAIWNKYDGKLPVLSNQKYNVYLKELAKKAGITTNLTSHIARKTFTTTILLQNDIPLKVVSAMLGHSNSSITEKYYAQVTNDLLDKHVSKLFQIFAEPSPIKYK